MTTAPTTPVHSSRREIVARMFRRKRTAVWGLRVTYALIVIAVYAPVIACDLPFVYAVEGEATVYPWWSQLFDVIAWEHALDRVFNAAMFTLPIWLIGRALLAQRQSFATARRKEQALRAYGVALLICTLLMPIVLGGSSMKLDYRERTELLQSQGRVVEQVLPPVPYGYAQGLPGGEHRFRSFSFTEGGHDHLFGTDEIGRDVFTRVLYGTRISLTIGIVAVAIYVSIGTVLGALAGFYGGRVDLVIMRAVEILLCIPGLFLILTIVALFEKRSIFLIMGAIGFVSWTGITRLVRGEFMRERHREYVDAARSMGFSDRRIVFRHILPNALGPVLVAASFGIPGAILTESGLSFLGLGDVSIPSWGRVLNDGRLTEYWHLILPPSIAIFITVTALNLVGDGLRDALDPKLRR